MKLHEGAINGTYRVVAINNLELPVERRLEAIGLTNGTNITILNKKKKGAMIVKVRGTRFAVGRHIAQGIEIEGAAQ
mgnify:FL=1